MEPALQFHPLTPERWPDFETFFRAGNPDAGGDVSRCWCMEWRLPLEQYQAGSGDGNRLAMKRLVESNAVPGILAYEGDRLVGWCSVSPRETLRLRRRGIVGSTASDDGVWSIICFYLPSEHRGKGLMSALLGAAVEYATDQGAEIVEGYPVDPAVFPAMAYTGLVPAFKKAGFAPVGSPIPGMTVMHRRITQPTTPTDRTATS